MAAALFQVIIHIYYVYLQFFDFLLQLGHQVLLTFQFAIQVTDILVFPVNNQPQELSFLKLSGFCSKI